MWPGYIIKTRQTKENVNNPAKKSHKYRLVSHYQGKKITNQNNPTAWKADGILGTNKNKKDFK